MPNKTNASSETIITATTPTRSAIFTHLVSRFLVNTGFGRTSESPFLPGAVTGRADGTWNAAKLARITLHECRHTFASLMIAAGVNAKALCSYMGHSSIKVTFDKYGHLMPGNEDEAAGLLDAYLERANTQARLAALER